MNAKTPAALLAVVTLGATAFAVSIPSLTARAATTITIARPNSHLDSLTVDYGAFIHEANGKPTMIGSLSSGVIDASLADEKYLEYRRGSDLGDFEPAPVGNFIDITTSNASQSSAVRSQIPLFATPGHNQINAFAYVPGSTNTSPNGGNGAPGSGSNGSGSTNNGPGTTGANRGNSGTKTNGNGTTPSGNNSSNTSGSTPTGSTTIGSSTTGSSNPGSGTSGKTNPGGTRTSTTNGVSATGATTASGTGSTTTTTTPGPHRSAPPSTTSPATGNGTSTTTTVAKSSPTTTVPASTTTTTSPTTSTSIPTQSIGMTNDHDGEAVVTATNMAPGESASELVTIGNDGTIPFQLSVQGTNATANSLGAALTLTITRVSDGQLIYQGALESPVVSVEEMAVDEATQFRIELELSSAAGNSYQDQTAKVDLIWSGQG